MAKYLAPVANNGSRLSDLSVSAYWLLYLEYSRDYLRPSPIRPPTPVSEIRSDIFIWVTMLLEVVSEVTGRDIAHSNIYFCRESDLAREGMDRALW